MSTSDQITQVASLTAKVKYWQDRAAAATDPQSKSVAEMMAGEAESDLQTALTQLQHSVDSTNSFLDNMALWGTLQNVATSLGTGIAGAVAIFKR